MREDRAYSQEVFGLRKVHGYASRRCVKFFRCEDTENDSSRLEENSQRNFVDFASLSENDGLLISFVERNFALLSALCEWSRFSFGANFLFFFFGS